MMHKLIAFLLLGLLAVLWVVLMLCALAADSITSFLIGHH